MRQNRIVFHGTKKENVENILKSGFNARTYFALNLADALEYGGEYIFYVILNCDDNNWQPRSTKSVSPKKITKIIKVNPKIIYENDNARIKFFGKGKRCLCPNCKTDIGNVKLSVFGKPTNPRCPGCNKLFKSLFRGFNRPQ